MKPIRNGAQPVPVNIFILCRSSKAYLPLFGLCSLASAAIEALGGPKRKFIFVRAQIE